MDEFERRERKLAEFEAIVDQAEIVANVALALAFCFWSRFPLFFLFSFTFYVLSRFFSLLVFQIPSSIDSPTYSRGIYHSAFRLLDGLFTLMPSLDSLQVHKHTTSIT